VITEGWVCISGANGVKNVGWDVKISPHFTAGELACPSSRIVQLHTLDNNRGGFLIWLEALRLKVGLPFYPTSACRSTAHNNLVGGHENSLHLMDNPKHATNGCMAIDIDITRWDSSDIDRLIDYTLDPWFNGSIGHGESRGFVHIDMRTWIGLPQMEFFY